MADGSINIDLLLNDQTDKTWTDFKQKAEQTGKDGYQKFKDAFKGDPLVAKLEAQANKAGINNFKELLNKLPKKKQTELLAKAEKGEVVNFEKLLREIPSKVTAEVELNDKATTGLRSIKDQAERVGDKFGRLKDIMIGTFVSNAIMGGIHAITSGIKEMVSAGMEYNKEQDTMKTVWTALTTEAPQDGKELVDYINTLSQHSIYAADNINEMAQSFYHVHSNVEETKKWTDAFVALGSTLHMTGPQISESGEMFAKIVAGGKASAEDMAVMINRFPMFGEALQKATGKSMKELYAMSAAGKLSAEQFTQALDYLGDKYKDGTAEAMTSMQGMSMYLKSRLSVLSGEVMKSSFNMSKSATAALQRITSDDSMKKFAESIGSAMGTVLDGISKIITYIDKNKDAIIGIIGNAKTIIGLIASGVWETFKDTINLIGTAFGKVSGNSGKAADPLKTVNSLLEEIANHKSALKALGSVMVALFATKKIYGFIAGIDATVKSMKELLIVQKIAELMDSYKLAQAAAAGGTSKLTLAQTALGLAMKSIPLVAIIGGIVAVGAAFYELYKHSDKFRSFINGVFEATKKVFEKVTEVVVDFVKKVAKYFEPLAKAFEPLKKTITAVFVSSFNSAKKTMKPFLEIAIDLLKSTGQQISNLKKPIDTVFGKIGDKIKSAVDKITGLWKSMKSGASSLGIFEKIGKLFEKMNGWLAANKKNFEMVANVISRVLGAAFVGLAGTVKVAFNIILVVAKAVFKSLVVIAKSLIVVFKGIFGLVAFAVVGAFTVIRPMIKPIFKGIVALIKGSFEIIFGIFKLFGHSFDLIIDIMTGNWKKAGKDLKNILKDISQIFTSYFKAIFEFTKYIFEAITKALEVVFKGWRIIFDNILEFISKLWTDVWDNIFNFFKGIWDGIKSVAKKSIEWVRDTIHDILDSISNVWNDTWSSLGDFFGNVWKGIKTAAQDGINGVLSVINAGVDAIDSVWKFFTGHETSIHHLKPVKFARGGIVENQLSMINDGAGSDWKELLQLPNGELKMSNQRNHVLPLPNGTRVYNGEETKAIMSMAGVKKYADGGIVGEAEGAIDWTKGKLSDIGSWIGDKMEAIEKFLKSPVNAVKGIISKSTSGMIGSLGNFGEMATGTFDKLTSGIADWFTKGLKKVQEETGDAGGGKGAPSGSGVTRWTSQVKEALKANGLSTSESMVNKVLRQIQTESGGNEKAVQGNIGDVNNASGDLAKGLMQVISATFNAYKFPGHNNPFNGYDSLLAGLNYAKHTYGNDLSFLGQGHGYANGGWAHEASIFGEIKGEPEIAINPARNTADGHIQEAIVARAKKAPNSLSAKLASVVNGAKSGMQSLIGQQPIVVGASSMGQSSGGIDLSGNVTMKINMDGNEIAQITYPKFKMLQNLDVQMTGQKTGNIYGR